MVVASLAGLRVLLLALPADARRQTPLAHVFAQKQRGGRRRVQPRGRHGFAGGLGEAGLRAEQPQPGVRVSARVPASTSPRLESLVALLTWK